LHRKDNLESAASPGLPASVYLASGGFSWKPMAAYEILNRSAQIQMSWSERPMYDDKQEEY